MTRRDHRQPLTLEDIKARCVEEGDCWIWGGGAIEGKFPVMWHQGRTRQVRRVVYMIAKGPIRKGVQIGVKCDNPLCVRDRCLTARTRAQAQTGRKFSASHRAALSVARRRRAKLTEEAAAEIRNSSERSAVLAEKHAVSLALVNMVKRGATWKDHTNPFAGLLRAA